jgi:D-aminopeptidase
MIRSLVIYLSLLSSFSLAAVRARDLGIKFDGKPGPSNAITDVNGVEVGQVSVVSGKGTKGEFHTARTGVTIVLPLGKKSVEGVPGAWWTLNGNGEMTGVSWLEESGLLEGPIGLTNTLSVGVVRDALADWVHKKFPEDPETGMLPFVAETDDSWLNDLYGHHVTKKHVWEALEKATPGAVAEGAVGAGTGTVAFGFKSGIGTSSRTTPAGYTVGVLVQSNFGQRSDLKILGIPVGKNLSKTLLPKVTALPHRDGSIVVVIATDAPLLPHQVKRLVKRAALGLARTGSLGRNSSGDFFIGFSTARPKDQGDGTQTWVAIKNDTIDDLFGAVVQSTEESIINALIAAKDSTGINGNQYFAIPHTFTDVQLQ